MINVDGVIIGNYRASMSGNDLNRRFADPDKKLHPEVQQIKNIIKNLTYGKKKDIINKNAIEILEEDIVAYIDMHGHSRKKCVFIYGN